MRGAEERRESKLLVLRVLSKEISGRSDASYVTVITLPLSDPAAMARLPLHSPLSFSLLLPLPFPLYNSSFFVSHIKRWGKKKKKKN